MPPAKPARPATPDAHPPADGRAGEPTPLPKPPHQGQSQPKAQSQPGAQPGSQSGPQSRPQPEVKPPAQPVSRPAAGAANGPPARANQPAARPPIGPRPPVRGPGGPALVTVFEGVDLHALPRVAAWDELTVIDPQPRLTLEYPGCPAACRLVDLFCPIGRGQRGLIVSPPKAGKTTLLKDIAGALVRNHPDIEIVVLLVDERPEEVTDFRRTFARIDPLERELAARGAEALGSAVAAPPRQRVRVVASSNDHDVDRHILVATQTIEQCKRMVEAGRHVVVLLDSLTRVGRAFNRSRKHSNSGRTLSGGLDSKALEVPRQIFGSARNTEQAGSLTIIATCLVDTGSVGDQVIFEEFKGSGNMELILDRKIAERRQFPAINLAESGTRKENLLMNEQELKTMTALRRRLLAMPPHVQVEQLLAALQRFPTNAALVGSTG